MTRFFRRLRARLTRNRLQDTLHEEIQLHVELRRQALIDAGAAPHDADVEARRQFGNVTRIREDTRALWGFPRLDTMAQDVSYGLRLMRRSPLFTSVAAVSLALGI